MSDGQIKGFNILWFCSDLSRNRLEKISPESFTFNKQLTTLWVCDLLVSGFKYLVFQYFVWQSTIQPANYSTAGVEQYAYDVRCGVYSEMIFIISSFAVSLIRTTSLAFNGTFSRTKLNLCFCKKISFLQLWMIFFSPDRFMTTIWRPYQGTFFAI